MGKFKAKFLTIANFLNWSPDEQLFALQQRVAGQAQTVLLNLNEEIRNPNDIFKILSDRFEVNQDTASLLNSFWSFKQDPNTPVKEFVALAKSKVITLVARQKGSRIRTEGVRKLLDVVNVIKEFITSFEESCDYKESPNS